MSKKSTRTVRLPEPRWTREESKMVTASAKKLGISVSAYIRQAALCYKP